MLANSDVRSGVTIIGGGSTGTLIVPLANTVKTGTVFGPDSNGATVGTFSGSGSSMVFPLGG